MDQQFSLSWNNFHGNLSKGFAGLLGNGEFVDVTIAVEGHLLQAHKVILSICSPYFKKMFQLNPCQHPIVVLRDVTHKAMRDLLQFMYHGEVSVKREDLTSFIGTAEVLQIKGLTNKETEEENVECEKEKPKQNLEPQVTNPGVETSTDVYNSSNNDMSDNSDTDLLKQQEFIEKLQRISSLKRKSDEYLQKRYYTDTVNTEKRLKVTEKPFVKINQTHQKNNFENVKSMFDESSVNITKSLNTSILQNNTDKDIINDKSPIEMEMENALDLKTECDDNDIIVSDPAVCTTPKTYDNSRDGNKVLTTPLEYQSPQDNALSLVINGSCDSQLPVRYKYIYSRKGHKQLVHMNFVYTKHSTTHGKTSWRCVQYFSLNRCPATIETIDAMIYAINHQHNHEDCYEKLSRNNIYEINTSPE